MLKRLVLASAIALGGSLAIASTAEANDQNIDIPFNGRVEFECEFGDVQEGTLVPDGFPAEVLTSLGAGGVPGLTDILCNGDAQIDITAVTKIAGPTTCVNPEYDPSVNGVPALPVQAGVLTDLIVNLVVDCNEPLAVGDYRYEVTLTAIP